MRNIIETIGGRITKRYRMYEKALGVNALSENAASATALGAKALA
jgi:hypothetical protein